MREGIEKERERVVALSYSLRAPGNYFPAASHHSRLSPSRESSDRGGIIRVPLIFRDFSLASAGDENIADSCTKINTFSLLSPWLVRFGPSVVVRAGALDSLDAVALEVRPDAPPPMFVALKITLHQLFLPRM